MGFHPFDQNLFGRDFQKCFICMMLVYIDHIYENLPSAFLHQAVDRQVFTCKGFSNVKYSVLLLSTET